VEPSRSAAGGEYLRSQDSDYRTSVRLGILWVVAGEEAVVGTNRRYADHYDQLVDARILDRIAAAVGPLQSLTDAELELDREPVTIAPRPQAVRAWVRFGPTAVRVDAEACRWTERAVGIRFTVGGRELRAWVWSSAVTYKE
jgi:hypothetical protein